jgi:hypothetical protein
MSLEPVTLRWLRRVRGLTYGLIGGPVAAGLVYTWWSAWRADVSGAVLGAALTLAVLGVGLLCSAWLRLGVAALRGERRVERLERRLEAGADAGRRQDRRLAHVEAELGQQGEQGRQQADQLAHLAEQNDARGRQVEQRLAGMQARIDTFCKLYDEQVDRLERRIARAEQIVRRAAEPADAVRISDSHWAAEDTPPGERTVAAFQHLVAQDGPGAEDAASVSPEAERRRLSQEFAGLIHRREYVEALAKGDEIADRFPESAAAEDFQRVRPHLVRRIQAVAIGD